MKKTYWLRLAVMLISIIVLLISYIGPCDLKINKCLGGDSILITRTFFHCFLAVLIISLFLLFISDNVFKKWLRFAIVWFIIDTILITLAPTYTGGWMNFGPTKESVSIWMGVLFVIISLVLIIWQSLKERKSLK